MAGMPQVEGSSTRVKWIRRAWTAALAAAWFVWLVSESTQTAVVLLLSLAAVASAGLPRAARRVTAAPGGMRRAAIAALAGCLLGALVPLLAAVMMLVKVSLHSHATPDFSTGDLVAVLVRTPVWVIGGGLLGAAAGLLCAGQPDLPKG